MKFFAILFVLSIVGTGCAKNGAKSKSKEETASSIQDNNTPCPAGQQKVDTGCVAIDCIGETTRACSVTNGTGLQSRQCVATQWQDFGTCTAVACNSGFKVSTDMTSCIAESTPTPSASPSPMECIENTTKEELCDISSGHGIRRLVCQNGAWAARPGFLACEVLSCDTGFHNSSDKTKCEADQCSWGQIELTADGCTQPEGGSSKKQRMCTAGVWSNYGACGVSCNPGYLANNNGGCVKVAECSPGDHSPEVACSLAFGTGKGKRVCGSDGKWSQEVASCDVDTCNPGWHKEGNACAYDGPFAVLGVAQAHCPGGGFASPDNFTTHTYTVGFYADKVWAWGNDAFSTIGGCKPVATFHSTKPEMARMLITYGRTGKNRSEAYAKRGTSDIYRGKRCEDLGPNWNMVLAGKFGVAESFDIKRRMIHPNASTIKEQYDWTDAGTDSTVRNSFQIQNGIKVSIDNYGGGWSFNGDGGEISLCVKREYSQVLNLKVFNGVLNGIGAVPAGTCAPGSKVAGMWEVKQGTGVDWASDKDNTYINSGTMILCSPDQTSIR